MEKIKLTARQWKAYEFMLDYREKKGFVPSVREVMEYMGYKSTSSAFDIFKQLDKVGAINRMPGCPRAYTINIEGFCQ